MWQGFYPKIRWGRYWSPLNATSVAKSLPWVQVWGNNGESIEEKPYRHMSRSFIITAQFTRLLIYVFWEKPHKLICVPRLVPEDETSETGFSLESNVSHVISVVKSFCQVAPLLM